MLPGCVTTPRRSVPADVAAVPHNTVTNRRSAEIAVEQAREMVQEGGEAEAIPRLQQIIGRWPESESAFEARYWLGVSYAQLNGYRDAIEVFEEYLRLNPEGRRAARASEYLNQLRGAYARAYTSPDELDAQIREVSQALEAAPGDGELLFELANLLWRRGNYDQAAEIYFTLATEYAQFAQTPEIFQRIEILPSGNYVALTPAERQRREIARQPIEVFNTEGFINQLFVYDTTQRTYTVSGQLRNRSDSVLYGVRAHVTIFDFADTVLDAQTRAIGRMSPGEVRAFSVQFTQFPSIHQIHDHEVTTSFER
jgi:tetratricopeptide (TPR) repeat protein